MTAFTRTAEVGFSDNATGSSVVFSAFTSVAGRPIVGYIGHEDSAGTTISVSDTAGNAYVVGTPTKHSAADNWITYFYCLSSRGNSSNVITITLGANKPYRNAHAAEYSVTGGGAVFVGASYNEGSSLASLTSPSIALGQSDGLLYAGTKSFNGTTITAGGSGSLIATQGAYGAASEQFLSAAGSYTATFNFTASPLANMQAVVLGVSPMYVKQSVNGSVYVNYPGPVPSGTLVDPVTSGNTAIYFTSHNPDANPIISVSNDTSHAPTYTASVYTGSGYLMAYIWQGADAAGMTKANIYYGSDSGCAGTLYEVAGLKTNPFVDVQYTTSDGYTTPQVAAYSTAAANALLLGWMTSGGGGLATAVDNGFVIDGTGSSQVGYGQSIFHKSEPAVGSNSVSITLSAADDEFKYIFEFAASGGVVETAFQGDGLQQDAFQIYGGVLAGGGAISGTAASSQVQTTAAVGTALLAITGTAASSQAQRSAHTGSLAFSGAASNSQTQTSAAAGSLGFAGTISGAQAQTSAATGSLGFSGAAASTQAQTSAAAGTVTSTAITGTAASSQAQTSAATGAAGIVGQVTSSQAQSSAATGSLGFSGSASSSQAQTTAATGDNITGIGGPATSSQAQTSAATGSAGLVGQSATAQAQTSAATGGITFSGVAASSQAQSSAATGIVLTAITGTATSSQAQTSTALGSVPATAVSAPRGGFGGRKVYERERPRTRADDFADELRAPYKAPTPVETPIFPAIKGSVPSVPTAVAALIARSVQSAQAIPAPFLASPPPSIKILPPDDEIPDEVYLLAMF